MFELGRRRLKYGRAVRPVCRSHVAASILLAWDRCAVHVNHMARERRPDPLRVGRVGTHLSPGGALPWLRGHGRDRPGLLHASKPLCVGSPGSLVVPDQSRTSNHEWPLDSA